MYMTPLLLAAAVGPTFAVPAQNTPYPVLTNNRREVVNFNAEVVRGLAPASDGSLYAINSHASLIVHHMDLGREPEEVFQTILNPVAIALWNQNRIVVVGAGTHALAVHDRNGGKLLKLIDLPSEPADVVVTPYGDLAFVSCQGANVVARVNLVTGAYTTHEIPAERPRYLFLDVGDDPQATSSYRLYVSAFNSGNGSVVLPVSGQRAGIADSYPFAALQPASMDKDLFVMDTGPNPTVTPVVQRAGTLITAHGRHPGSKRGTDYWILNVDSLNQDPLRQSEPKLRGDFIKNQLWIGPVDTSLVVANPSDQIDLDEKQPGSGYDPSYSVAFPMGIGFGAAADSPVYICSPLNDCVSIRNPDGSYLSRIDLPEGSIPMDVEVDTVWNLFVFVHCWGTNTVRAHLTSNPQVFWELDLGPDPTPAPIKAGREIWYDGERSMNARSSCNSCHPGGKSDFIGWQISDDPTDRKDVMVTQSLLGIEDTFPYHWRGERALIDFNGAFVDLLGGSTPLTTGPGSEFEAFQAFVFSLQNHANPLEDLSREIAPASDHFETTVGDLFGDPQNGLTLFETRRGFNQMTCMECHLGVSGSNGEFINEVASDVPSTQVMEVAHLRELRHKDQPSETITLGPASVTIARSGFGLAHSGIAANIVEFILSGGSFMLSDAESADVAAFVRRFDQGIAPAAHFGVKADSSSWNDPRIQSVLVPQSMGIDRGIDLVAFGTFTPAGATQPVFARFVRSQVFNPVTPVNFQCSELAPTTTIDLGTLLTQAQSGAADLTFLGVPPGSGRRFALDPDNDDLTDFEEKNLTPQPTFPWIADSDGDGQLDGYEVRNLNGNPRDVSVQATDTTPPTFSFGQLDFVSASVAKFHFETSEPTRASSSFSPGGAPAVAATNPVFAKSHTYVVQGLAPSTPSTAPGAGPNGIKIANVGTITITDHANLTANYNFSQFGGDLLHPIKAGGGGVVAEESPLVLTNLMGGIATTATSMTITGTAQVRQRFFDPAGVNLTAVQNLVAVFQAVRETTPNMYEVVPAPTSTLFIGNQIDLVDNAGVVTTLNSNELPGPFVFAPVSSTGSVSFDVTVGGLSSGKHVRLRLIALLEPLGPNGPFVRETFGRVQIPATKGADRGLEFTMP